MNNLRTHTPQLLLSLATILILALGVVYTGVAYVRASVLTVEAHR